MIRIPGHKPGSIVTPISTVGVTPALTALAGIDLDEIMPWTDGQNLLPLIDGIGSAEPVFMEYAAEGSIAPLVGIRNGDFKFVHCKEDPPQLFDLAFDPDEMQNLAKEKDHKNTVTDFMELDRLRGNMHRFDAEVRESQARRHIVYAALCQGRDYPWDYQPLPLASERYMRNHMDLNVLEESKRYPREE